MARSLTPSDTRRRESTLQRNARFGIACVALAFAAGADAAQSQCALDVKPHQGETGYRNRKYGCEGLYVQLQAATINVQVISLVKGELDLPAGLDTTYIHVPGTPDELRERIAVFGRGRQANLNWALDGDARKNLAMKWALNSVVQKVELDTSHIGVFGETKRTDGLGAPVYVPVHVQPSAAIEAAGTPTRVQVVLRVPAAGALQYRLGDGDWMPNGEPLKPYNGDGYFKFELSPTKTGPVDLEVRWRPSGKLQQYGAPESLKILFW